jgi:trehalose 6-phosphate synthase/phosphatase
MRRLFIASHRIPVAIDKQGDEFIITPAGKSTIYDLPDFAEYFESKWIGLTEIDDHMFSDQEKKQLSLRLEEYRAIPLFPDPELYHASMHGFAKNTLWPIFHYFPQNATYNDTYWEGYVRVNQMYSDLLCEYIEDGDTVWIHDYHLLLLPRMIRLCKPNVSIGLFVHIPFPSFEVFRLIPWREEILDSMLSADLIGFNVFDYVRHFLSSVRRIKGYDTTFNRVAIGERTMLVDVFPKGIHFDNFTSEVRRLHDLHSNGGSEIQGQIANNFARHKDKKIILSIDPLDYTKGIPHRLLAFELFLQLFPNYLEEITLVLLALQTGESSKSYNSIKKRVDELVGRINGLYGTISWTPIVYLNQKFSENELVDIYAYSDIALILPLRDGMNMAAKEFVASRLEGKGVLILSELAGASKELHEAIIVNPNNLGEIAEAIKDAIEMPDCEQIRRNDVMTERIRRYTIEKWANEFIKSLDNVKHIQETNLTRKINEERIDLIVSDYKKSENRILFLDYDGTLSGFKKNPEDAKPDEELYSILSSLTKDKSNTLVIISGRDKDTLERWFKGNSNIHFIAEHGVWLKNPGSDWLMMEQIDNDWKSSILPILEYYVDQTPNTFIEEKNFSLVWHYRKADPDLGIQRSWELKEQLRNMTANLNLEIMDGDKVIEIKFSGINKGRAANKKIGNLKYDFIIAVGDDWTDEYTFEAMPENAYTIKVGTKTTKASLYIESVDMVRELLKNLSD